MSSCPQSVGPDILAKFKPWYTHCAELLIIVPFPPYEWLFSMSGIEWVLSSSPELDAFQPWQSKLFAAVCKALWGLSGSVVLYYHQYGLTVERLLLKISGPKGRFHLFIRSYGSSSGLWVLSKCFLLVKHIVGQAAVGFVLGIMASLQLCQFPPSEDLAQYSQVAQ